MGMYGISWWLPFLDDTSSTVVACNYPSSPAIPADCGPDAYATLPLNNLVPLSPSLLFAKRFNDYCIVANHALNQRAAIVLQVSCWMRHRILTNISAVDWMSSQACIASQLCLLCARRAEVAVVERQGARFGFGRVAVRSPSGTLVAHPITRAVPDVTGRALGWMDVLSGSCAERVVLFV